MYGNPAPDMAAFSSRGPNPVDPNILKPDVTAPGVDILAAWPTNVSPTPIKSDKRSKSANPFVFGSGHIDPEKASDPGLIYDISTQDYLDYLCSLMGQPVKQTSFGVDLIGS
ncbi:subtilisin-like protease sbt5.4 [Phtheirospermum japonicum]|uniref:Subtilisin-like protease sbt5.4 n=1 Tax=Phtheirospermum japonicum TaxID=374723 RepID=A0A830BF64_9LAMI|nr:subtilisin-like protease sbt5.4 [Phtheirospermum japonicum]